MGKHKQVTCRICFKPIRSDTLKRHRKVHLKYSIESSLSTEDMCRDLVLEIVDQVADPKDVISGMKRKHEEVECETQTTENKDQSHNRYELNRVFDDNTMLDTIKNTLVFSHFTLNFLSHYWTNK